MYDYPLFRPPSEADSLILQVTLGCSYNKCTFCGMYKDKKFTVKSEDEIEQHILIGKRYAPNPEKIFLADGNVLCLTTPRLLKLLNTIKNHFPKVKQISSYAGPLDLLRKSEEELIQIRQAGLDLLYLGVESGSDRVLQSINKGVTREQMIAAGKKAKKTGFALSCMVISGLGGKELLEEHAIDSATAISEINPDYFGLLTLIIVEDTPLKKQLDSGEFELLSPNEVMLELKIMLDNLELENCVFRANHASNYVPLKGILNRDKQQLLHQVNSALSSGRFKPEAWRGL
jgi:radical SAM superfamily enzyme YgiQ (UPF0313 family)